MKWTLTIKDLWKEKLASYWCVFSPEANGVRSMWGLFNTCNFFLCILSLLLQLKENGFPGDMALTPKESLQLYNTMVEKWCGKESLQVSR